MFAQSRLLIALAALFVVGGVVFYLIPDEDRTVHEIDPSAPTTAPIPDGESKPDTATKTDLAHPPDSVDLRNTAIKVIEFPDGETLSFRSVPEPTQPDVPGGPIAEHYETLSREANAGDGDSAFLLFRVLGHCESAYRTEKDLESAIDQLHQTHTLPSNISNNPIKVLGTDNMVPMENLTRENYARCKGVTNAQVQEADDWLVMAADAGNSYAMKRLAQRLRRSDRSRALKYLESAWSSGDLEAASQLGYLYAHSPADQVDLMRANTYLYLHDLITEEIVATGGEYKGSPPSKEAYARIASLLMPDQVAQSLIDAKEIMKSNQNCCFSHRLKY